MKQKIKLGREGEIVSLYFLLATLYFKKGGGDKLW